GGGVGGGGGGRGAAVVGARWVASGSVGATHATALAFGLGAALIGLAIAGVAIAAPAWRDARAITVVGARRTVGRERAPRWMRFGVDIILLAVSGLVFWATSRNGYKLVLAPEGTPSISVNYWAL